MSWITPIYDRVLADITNLTSKGYFNVADWNRIYGDALVLHALVELVNGVSITFTIPGETAPAITSFPDFRDFNILLTDLELIRVASLLPLSAYLKVLETAWVGGANGTTPDYEDVNDWERNIQYLRELMRATANNRIRCGAGSGTVRTGQPRVWQHRWRRFEWADPGAVRMRYCRSGFPTCGSGITWQNRFRSSFRSWYLLDSSVDFLLDEDGAELLDETA